MAQNDNPFVFSRCLELWNFVVNGYPEPANQAAELSLTNGERDLLRENKKKDAKALCLIQHGIDENIFPKISPALNSKIAQDILETNYNGTI